MSGIYFGEMERVGGTHDWYHFVLNLRAERYELEEADEVELMVGDFSKLS